MLISSKNGRFEQKRRKEGAESGVMAGTDGTARTALLTVLPVPARTEDSGRGEKGLCQI